MKAFNKVVLASILGLSSVAALRAAEDAPNPRTIGTATTTTAATAPTTDEGLEAMLTQMGYEVKVTGEEGQSKWFRVTLHRADLSDIVVSLRLGSGGTMLWGHIYLNELKPEDQANAARILKLLELNDDIAPNSFRVNPTSKRLFLSRGTEARGLTPAKLREHLDGLANCCVKTQSHWDTEKWTPAVTRK